MAKVIHVVAAAICDDRGQVLVARRAQSAHQGGLWEFPGGKVEAGESRETALSRELQKELGITPSEMRTLICLTHHYPDKSVCLDVWKVSAFTGVPEGKEGQPLAWVAVDSLNPDVFPAANAPIIKAVQFSELIAVSPAVATHEEARQWLKQQLAGSVGILQLRLPDWPSEQRMAFAIEHAADVVAAGKQLLVNVPVASFRVGAGLGLHLPQQDLMALSQRPVSADTLFTVSCHDLESLQKAEAVHADAILLGTVLPSASHPDGKCLGWDLAAQMISSVRTPVYLLGGMNRDHLLQAWSAGAQGVAGIRSFL